MRILMVEDEKYMAKAVAEILKKNNYTVDLAYDGEYGRDCAVSGIYDIIILDIMLPKVDGLTVLKDLRKTGIEAPVILLTAKGELDDKIKGLDSGADDYLAKPFHTDELLARLRALNRRKPEFHNGGILAFGDIKLEPSSLTLSCDISQKKVKLRLKEAQILELLINNKNMIVSKTIIIEKIWGYDAETEDNSVEIHISRLRRHMENIKSDVMIRSTRSTGYMLLDETCK